MPEIQYKITEIYYISVIYRFISVIIAKQKEVYGSRKM